MTSFLMEARMVETLKSINEKTKTKDFIVLG
jgi:hypothetical protein